MDERIKEFLSKPFPEKNHPEWLVMIFFYSEEERQLMVKHWYKSFAKYYDQLQRSNYFKLDDHLWKYRNEDMPQFSDLEFLYAFNDYQLCHAQGVEMEDVFDGPVPFFEESRGSFHALFAQLYRLTFDHGGLNAVDTLRYHAARSPLVQIRRLCQNYMIKCIDEDYLLYSKYGATELMDIMEDNKTVSPLSPDILPSDINWLRNRCIGFDLAMRDLEHGDKSYSKEAPSRQDLYGLLNCAEDKKEEIVSEIGEYLKEHHTGNDIARLVIALKEYTMHDDTDVESERPLLTFTTFSFVFKAIIDMFPSYGIVQYNTANEAHNKLNLLWDKYKSAPGLKQGKGKTGEQTYLRDMEHITAIKKLMQKFQKILSA